MDGGGDKKNNNQQNNIDDIVNLRQRETMTRWPAVTLGYTHFAYACEKKKDKTRLIHHDDFCRIPSGNR
jgi:hypothetical protein